MAEFAGNADLRATFAPTQTPNERRSFPSEAEEAFRRVIQQLVGADGISNAEKEFHHPDLELRESGE